MAKKGNSFDFGHLLFLKSWSDETPQAKLVKQLEKVYSLRL